MKKRVVVTGIGVAAPNGVGKEEFWEANVRGISGIDEVSTFDVSRYQSKVAACINGFDPCRFMSEKTARSVDRFVHLGVASARMAMDDSGLTPECMDKSRTGVIIGSGLGGVLFHEEQLADAIRRDLHKIHPFCVPRITPNSVAAHIAIEHGLLGPNFVICSACAAGSHAIGEAFRKIQYGEADVMFTGGAEAPLTQHTFLAFASLRVLSTSRRPPGEASRPFDKERDGFVLGEGAAVLILEALDHALARDARIYAEVAGYGLTSGAYHMVMPAPDGKDAARTMQMALRDAGLDPGDIHYINAHGTGTKQNDISETRAIKEVFGSHAFDIPISSTKSMIGHGIGAAGAMEAVVCCLAMQNGMAPPTINLTNPDPECDLDYVPLVARPVVMDAVLSNSFGFGSVNACLALKKLK